MVETRVSIVDLLSFLQLSAAYIEKIKENKKKDKLTVELTTEAGSYEK